MATYLRHVVSGTVNTTTTGDVVVTGCTYTLPDNTAAQITAEIAARRTGGSSGAAGDSAGYQIRQAVKRDSAGAATLIGSISQTDNENVAGYNALFSVSSNDIRVAVTGVATTNISWFAVMTITLITP